MRILAINLDRAPERWTSFQAQAAAAGLTAERLPATDGRALPAADLAALVRPDPLEPMSAGVVACFLSHRRAWQSLVDSGEPWLAVFEDDVHLSPGSAALLRDPAWIPAGVDLVKLDTMLEGTQVSLWGRAAPDGRRLFRLLGLHSGGAGYALSRRAALFLLQRTEVLEGPVDLVLFDPRSSLFAALRSFQLSPALCVQDETLARDGARPVTHASDLESERARLLSSASPAGAKPRGRKSRPGKLLRELLRPFRQLGGKLGCLLRSGAWPRRALIPFR